MSNYSASHLTAKLPDKAKRHNAFNFTFSKSCPHTYAMLESFCSLVRCKYTHKCSILKTDIFRNIAIRETFTHIVSTDNFRRQYTDKGNFNLTPLSVAQQVRPINFHLIVCAIRAESESR